MDTEQFALNITELVKEKQGKGIKVLDIRKISTICDYFVICSADSTVQVKAIADNIDGKLSKNGIKCFNKEGYEELNWVLLDYFDVIVHVFRTEMREYYNLEKLWGDAPVTEIEDDTNFEKFEDLN